MHSKIEGIIVSSPQQNNDSKTVHYP